MKRKAVFFDRDGVLNHAQVIAGKPYPPDSIHTTRLIEDAAPALATLSAHDFLLIGVTNQPDVARGKTSKAAVEAINQFLLSQLPLTVINTCYHDDEDACLCRKPAPGLLHMAAHAYAIDLSKSYMIGDRWKDIAAGKQAHCKTIFLDYKYQEAFKTSVPDFTATSLTQAVDWIIDTTHEETYDK